MFFFNKGVWYFYFYFNSFPQFTIFFPTEECIQKYRTNAVFIYTPQICLLLTPSLCSLTCCHTEMSETSFICTLKLRICSISDILHWLLNSKITGKKKKQWKNFFLYLLMTFPDLLEPPVVPTTSDVSLPSVHTNTWVTDSQSHTALFAAALTSAWRETTGGSHVTFWMTVRESLVHLMVAKPYESVELIIKSSRTAGF
jgi:hypothetical protein